MTDENWTVNCPCGVTHDDGNKMVSCDKCSVWVHTFCVGFVDRKNAQFHCNECRRKDGHPPHKLIPGYNSGKGRPISAHVHGVPGGDPALFEGSPYSIVNRQLWKATGNIPKRLNCQYREFPEWDNTDPLPSFGELLSVDPKRQECLKNHVGADARISLMKEAKPRLKKHMNPVPEEDIDEDGDEDDQDADEEYNAPRGDYKDKDHDGGGGPASSSVRNIQNRSSKQAMKREVSKDHGCAKKKKRSDVHRGNVGPNSHRSKGNDESENLEADKTNLGASLDGVKSLTIGENVKISTCDGEKLSQNFGKELALNGKLLPLLTRFSGCMPLNLPELAICRGVQALSVLHVSPIDFSDDYKSNTGILSFWYGEDIQNLTEGDTCIILLQP